MWVRGMGLAPGSGAMKYTLPLLLVALFGCAATPSPA